MFMVSGIFLMNADMCCWQSVSEGKCARTVDTEES